MKAAFLLLFLVAVPVAAQAQKDETLRWQTDLGGDGTDILQSLDITPDGGCIVAGYSYSARTGDKQRDTIGGYDLWIARLDVDGKLLWQQTLGGNRDDIPAGIHAVDGGYLLGATSFSPVSFDKSTDPRGNSDFWLIILDSLGRITGQSGFGGDSAESLADFVPAANGGYFAAGSSGSKNSGDKKSGSYGGMDYWVLKLDARRRIQWQKTFGGRGSDILTAVVATADGGCFVGGYSDSDSSGSKNDRCRGFYDYWVLKLDATGSIQWQRTLGGEGIDMLSCLLATADGGYLLGGTSGSSRCPDKAEDVNGIEDYWIVRLDSSGHVRWESAIGGSGTDRLRALAPAPAGGFAVAGHSNSGRSGDKSQDNWAGYDIWIVLTDSSGQVVSDRTIGGSDWDEVAALLPAGGKGYVVGGYSRSGFSGDKWQDNKGSFDYWLMYWDPSRRKR